jgi:hypothetical protein
MPCNHPTRQNHQAAAAQERLLVGKWSFGKYLDILVIEKSGDGFTGALSGPENATLENFQVQGKNVTYRRSTSNPQQTDDFELTVSDDRTKLVGTDHWVNYSQGAHGSTESVTLNRSQ